MKKYVLIIALLLTISLHLMACDMMALIAKEGNNISWFNGSIDNWQLPNDPHDYFDFLDHFSPSNPDGYGIIYIDNNGNIPEIDFPNLYGYPTTLYDVSEQAWYVIPNDNGGSTGTISYCPGPYNDAKLKILNSDNDVGIVMGHVRDASGTARGNHPFQLICDTDNDGSDETFMFMHNGNVSDMVTTFRSEIDAIDNQWFSNHLSNWEGNPTSTSNWIDSEMYFHYIIAHIKEANGNVMKGIYSALSNITAEYQTDISINTGLLNNYVNANFVLSDGENLYLYKNCNDVNHMLGYDDSNSGFIGIQTSNSQSQFTQLQQNSFAIISKYGNPVIMNNFLISDDYHTDPENIAEKTYYYYNFISGEIDNSTTDLNIHYKNTYISGDTYICNNHTLDLDPVNVNQYTFNPEIKFAGHHNLYIEGTLNVNEDASIKLSNSSMIEISDNGILFLDWGSTITGSTPTTLGATPPGNPVGGEIVPGDRIIAKNGGIITTDILNNYTPGVDSEVTISSSSNDLWDGIIIQNPGDYDDFWFVNCDISGIDKLSIEDLGLSSRTHASLNLHHTDFYDAGQIIVRDGHYLTIEGSASEGYCYIQNNSGCPINAYESPVFLDYVWVGGSGNENDGAGIYLYGSSTPQSNISNSKILNNYGSGATLNGISFGLFNYNHIRYNNGFGMMCINGTQFIDDEFAYLRLTDNGYAEYAGQENTFAMSNRNANHVISDSNYGSGADQYLLMNYNWNGTIPVDIRGTNLTSSDLAHMYPNNSIAWTFGGGITIGREMLASASSDIGNGNYDDAEQTLQQIIVDYPTIPEAGTAVYYLYHLETLSDQDFAGLRAYLNNISAQENTHLELAINKIVTKAYMKDKDYLIAIDRLETVINNSQIPDEVVSAMIDQGYCYMELAEEGERSLPSECTVKTATIEDYQAEVRELETQFSFYPENNNQNTSTIPNNIVMHTNHPNPFNPNTTISFDLVRAANVRIEIFNIKGQKVITLMDEYVDNGTHSVYWNGKNTTGKAVTSGLYFYKLTSGKDLVTKKMLLLK